MNTLFVDDLYSVYKQYILDSYTYTFSQYVIHNYQFLVPIIKPFDKADWIDIIKET